MEISISAYKYVGYTLLKHITDIGTEVKFVTTIKDYDDPYFYKIKEICHDNNIPIHIDLDINSDQFRTLLLSNNIDLHFMLWFPTIVKKKSIKSVNKGFVNLHPSLLPYNRGMHPWYWSIVDKTPAGVTIHFIDEKIDNGPIIAQKEVKITTTDTGETLYSKLVDEIIKLFIKTFGSIINNQYTIINKIGNQTFHLAKELNENSNIDLNKVYKAEDLINIIRARTFTSGKNAYFYKNGIKYNIKLEISRDE